MSNIIYHAKSLEDIAKMFDDLGNGAVKLASKVGRTKVDQARASGECYAWITAAQILRQTKLGE